MSDNRIEFELLMKDDATKVMNNFKANVNTQSQAVQAAFQKMQGATAQSTNALMNFNRVIQDAPYGIMGVANNLNPLFESFQRLTKETGSTKTAIMSMIQGIASPAGIGIAIAAISSLAVVFGSMSKKAKVATEETNSFADSLAFAEKNVRELTRAQQVQTFWNNEAEIFRLSERYRELSVETQRLAMSRSILGIVFASGKDDQKNAINEQIKALTDYNKKIEEIMIDSDKREAKKKDKTELHSDFDFLPNRETLDQGIAAMKDAKAMAKKLNEQKADEDWKIFWDNEKKKLKATDDILAAKDAAYERYFQLEQNRLAMYQQTAFTIFQQVGAALGNSLAGQDATARQILRSIANMFITMAEAAMFAATAMANAKGIATFWASMIADGPGLFAGFAALETARAVINSFHQGGTVGDFTDQPASKEFPIMVRGGETVRTEGQERDLINSKGSKGTTVNININGKGLIPRDIQKAVQMGMRQTGLTVDKYFVNQRSKVVFT